MTADQIDRIRERMARIAEEHPGVGAKALEALEAELDALGPLVKEPSLPLDDDPSARIRRREAQTEMSGLPTSSIQDVLDRAAQIVVGGLNADFTKVMELLPDGDLLVRAGVGWPPGVVGATRDQANLGSQAGYTMMTGDPVIIEDLAHERRFTVPQAVRDLGVVSSITAPIPGKHRPFGVLQADSKRARAYSYGDLRFVMIAANTIGSAISLARAERALALQREISQTLNSADSMRQAAAEFLRAMCHYLDCSAAGYWCRGRHPRYLRLGQHWMAPGYDGGYPCADGRFRMGEGILGRVWKTGKPEWSPDVGNDPGLVAPEELQRSGVASGVFIPVPGRNGIMGVIELFKKTPFEPDADMLSVLDSLAQQIGQFGERVNVERQLREREREFRALVEHSPDVIGRHDREMRCLYLSPAMERNTGIPVDEFMGESFSDQIRTLISPEDLDACRKAVLGVFDTGREEVLELQCPMPDGLRTFQTRVVPELDEQGNVVTVLSLSRDITDLKLAQEAATARENEFRALVEHNPDAIVRVDRELRRLYVNASAIRLTGVPEGGMTPGTKVGDGFEEVLNETEWKAAIQHAFETGEEQRAELYFSHPDGTRVHEGRIVPEFDEDGRAASVMIIGRDITEQKRAQDEAQTRYEQLRALVEATPIGMIIADAKDQRIILANREFERLVNRRRRSGDSLDQNERGAVIRWPDGTAIPPEKLPLRRALNNKEFVQAEEHIIEHPDGSLFWAIGTSAPVLDSNGDVVAAILVLQDVSRLRELDRLRSDFLSMVGHEIRTPLAIIRLAVGSLLAGTEDLEQEEITEALETVDQQADRINDMLTNLRDMAQIEAGSFSVHKEPGDLREVVTRAADDMRRIGVDEIQVRIPDTLPPVPMDRERVLQVIENLLNNAARHGAQGKPIDLEVEASRSEVMVHVRNRGHGIPKKRQVLLFRKFSRLGRSREGGGTGLGLVISKGIVEAHGGRIWVESSGRSSVTTFSFTLPVEC